jgi:hypothetical protein
MREPGLTAGDDLNNIRLPYQACPMTALDLMGRFLKPSGLIT